MTTPDTLRALASRLRAGEAGTKIDVEAAAALGCPAVSGEWVKLTLTVGGVVFHDRHLSTVLTDTFALYDEKFADRWQLLLSSGPAASGLSKWCVLTQSAGEFPSAGGPAPTRCAALLIAMCEAAAMEMEAGDAEG